MESLCVRCAQRTIGKTTITAARAQIGTRSFSVSHRVLDDKKSQDSGVAQSGRPLGDALGRSGSQTSQPRNSLIRRVSDPERSSPIRKTSSPTSGPVLRRPPPTGAGQGRPQSQGPVLRRSSSPQTGQVLRRAAPPGAAQGFDRARGAVATGGSASPRPTGTFLRRPGQGQGQGQDRQARQQGAGQRGQRGQNQKGPDRRRRNVPRQDEEEFDEQSLSQQMEEYITKYVDRPANPTKPLPYNPAKLTLDDLKPDWPNTILSTSGMTESVIQKVEWLSRRLPHGYQSPEQIAEHYLKGNFTRFESEEEKQKVLKLASELSAKTKTETEDGTLHKHESPRFPVVEDAAFTSLASKSTDKSHLVATSIKGDYDKAQQQKYAFMQSVERLVNNNESYGPVQSAKLLSRVQALIPQARTGGAQQAKRA